MHEEEHKELHRHIHLGKRNRVGNPALPLAVRSRASHRRLNKAAYSLESKEMTKPIPLIPDGVFKIILFSTTWHWLKMCEVNLSSFSLRQVLS